MAILDIISDLVGVGTDIAQTTAGINNQRKQTKLETERQDFQQRQALQETEERRLEREARKKSRQQGDANFNRARTGLNALEDYQINDLIEDLRLGQGKDDLKRYQNGQALKQKLINESAFNKLAQNKIINQAESENLALLKQLRDTPISSSDIIRNNALLRKQRDANRTLQKTITERAIERGVDPQRARLTERLLNAQQTANRQNELSQGLVADAANRRIQATRDIQSNLRDAFGRRAQIAQAEDNRTTYNVNRENESRKDTLSRHRQTQDANTNLENQTIKQNQEARLRARRDVIDSRNLNRRTRADLNSAQAQTQYNY